MCLAIRPLEARRGSTFRLDTELIIDRVANPLLARFVVHPIPQYNGSVERESWFRAVPFNELVDGVPVPALRIDGRETKCSSYAEFSRDQIGSHAPARYTQRPSAKNWLNGF